MSLEIAHLGNALIELGAPVVASNGRLLPEGGFYLEGAEEHFGIGFADGDIAFVGQFEHDLEATADASPDLSVTRTWEADVVERIQLIAPTVALDPEDPHALLRELALVANRLDEHERLRLRYEEAVARARVWLPEDEALTYSYIYPLPSGGIIVSGLEGGITLALEDLGFVAPGPVQAIFDRAGEDWAEVSLERLADLNADIVLTGYHERTDPMGAAMRYDDLDRMLPGWCAVLPACREGRMVAVPWNRGFPLSYRSLTETVSHLTSHIVGRPPAQVSD